MQAPQSSFPKQVCTIKGYTIRGLFLISNFRLDSLSDTEEAENLIFMHGLQRQRDGAGGRWAAGAQLFSPYHGA